jgi:hypothetical protein
MRVRPARFNVGDWVFLYCPRRKLGRSAKWSRYYSGPYLITKVLGAVNFLIQRSPRAKAQVVHIDKLKRCEGTTPASWLTTPADRTEPIDRHEPEAAETTPTDPPRVGGGQSEQRSDEPEQENGSGVTTKVDIPNSPPPSGVNSDSPPERRPEPTRVQPKRNAPRPRRFLMSVRNSVSSGSGEGRLQ